MFNFSETTKQIILIMMALFIIALGVGILVSPSEVIEHYAFALLFGTIFSILKLVLLEKTIERAVDMTGSKAVNYARLHYVLRFFLTFLVLFIANYRQMNIYGVVIGVLLSTPAVYIMHFKNRKNGY